MSSRAWPARGRRGAPPISSGITSGTPSRGNSVGSIDSHRSTGSIRSILSAGSIYSVASAGSILSMGSAGSILSIGSAGSILSIGSAGSILSIRSVGGILCKDNEPMFPSVSRSAVRTPGANPPDAGGGAGQPGRGLGVVGYDGRQHIDTAQTADDDESGGAQIIDLRRAAGQSPSS